MYHNVTARAVEYHIASCDLALVIEVDIVSSLVSGGHGTVLNKCVSDKDDLVVALDLSYESLVVGIYVDADLI